MNRRTLLAAVSVALVLSGSACGGEVPGAGDDYPQKRIELTVGFGAGGPLDLVARGLKDNVKSPYQIDVVNREGAGGTIAASEVMRSKPDGYTAYLGSTTIMSAQPHLIKGLAYDDPSTYVPLLKVVSYPQVLAVGADSPYDSISDVVAAGSDGKKGITIGTGGEGTIGHLTTELVADETKMRYTHVPFKGFSESVPALLGGHVKAIMATPADVLPHIKSGDMKAIAVFSNDRATALPDTPTVVESGIDVVQDNYYFVALPPKVDPKVASALRKALKAAMDQPDFASLAKKSGARVDYADQAGLTKELTSDYDRFGKIVKQLGLGSAND